MIMENYEFILCHDDCSHLLKGEDTKFDRLRAFIIGDVFVCALSRGFNTLAKLRV